MSKQFSLHATLTSALDVSLLAILFLVPVEPDVGHQNVAIVRNKVFDNLRRAVLDIDISPVHPRVLWLECGRKKVVSSLAHHLSSRPLGLEAVSVLDILAQTGTKVLLNDHCASERDIVLPPLYPVQFSRKNSECVVCRIAHEECQVNEFVRVSE